MSFRVIPIEKFKKEAKRLIKKYPSLKEELYSLAQTLSENPESGTSLGSNTYKLRISIKSKGKWKSGGARLITYIITSRKECYLLTIYDKAEIDSVDDRILRQMIKSIRPGG